MKEDRTKKGSAEKERPGRIVLTPSWRRVAIVGALAGLVVLTLALYSIAVEAMR
jgi:hypothetical protein